MTRPHPYDEIFAPVADAAFQEIQRAAGHVSSMADFAKVPATSRFLEAVTPPQSAPPDPLMIGGFAHLAYTLYRFWQDGRRTITVLQADLTTTSLESQKPVGDSLPGGAYLQFPERWFWARIDETAPHEPLDGIFVAPTAEDVAITAILGFRPERVGFSQLTALADAAAFAAAPDFQREPPFAPVMEGGAAAGFRSLVSESELIHLTQLALGWGAE